MMVRESREAVAAPSGFLACVAGTGELIAILRGSGEFAFLPYHSTPKAGGAETGPSDRAQSSQIQAVRAETVRESQFVKYAS